MNMNQRNLTEHVGLVTSAERESILRQRSLTIWITGLSASGKSTLAYALERALIDLGRACYVLDGDTIRKGLNNNLGFSAEDRTENIRRIAEVAHLMNDAGLIVISAFISPFRSDRESARQIIGVDRFVEVYISTCLSDCEARDPKGLYRLARSGKLAHFTGISSPYEPPVSPALTIDTAELDLSKCVGILLGATIGRSKQTG